MLKRLLVVLLVMGLFSGSAWAVLVTPAVENHSFEEPNSGKQKCWDGEKAGSVDVPGWSSDTEPSDSGVESAGPRFPPTDGDWTGFLKGADPSVWQLTGHVIAADEVFILAVDAENNWGATQFLLSLYYDDGGTRVTAASKTVDLLDGNNPSGHTAQEKVTFTLTFSANDVPASIGHNLGIELDNPDGGTWVGMDNVRFVPEPATIALLGLGVLSLLRRRRA